MLTGALRNQLDRLREEFWTGGVANPLTVIEQLSLLMFLRLLDRPGQALPGGEAGQPYGPEQQHLRWSRLVRVESPERLLGLMRDEVFPHLRALGPPGSRLREVLADAQLAIQKPALLASAVRAIEALPLTGDDTQGDLYEHLLSRLTTAGINGQFRTPRHIIRFMIELIEPEPTAIVGDPACGTGGFLVGTVDYLRDRHGAALDAHREHLQRRMLHGFDFDATMLRIASMNLLLHGVIAPGVHYQDTLSASFSERFGALAEGGFDVIFANPPFKGSLDEADVHPALTAAVRTRKTELLFLALILRMLRPGGRSAALVPEGVLFGSSKAHVALRRRLVDEQKLEAILSLPPGVFRPYAGVSTAIVVFTRTDAGGTDRVFFSDIESDGFSLDDRREPLSSSDLPSALAAFRRRGAGADADRTAKHFLVPADDIRERGYDLSINRYRQAVHREAEHEPPRAILARMRSLEAEIASDLRALERLL